MRKIELANEVVSCSGIGAENNEERTCELDIELFWATGERTGCRVLFGQVKDK